MSHTVMQLLPLILNFLVFGLLLGVAFLVSSFMEQRHLRSLERREAELAAMVVTNLRRLPANWEVQDAFMVTGSVVMAGDYFKMFLARMRNFVGGNIRGYEFVLDRAYREARLRLLEQARDYGAQAVWNVRLESATIVGGRRAAGVEVLAYGTALRLKGTPPADLPASLPSTGPTPAPAPVAE